jgi:uncharacterized membrane protein YcaP (DUF421 family)
MTGITIGSIAAEFATDLENPAQPLTAMIIYGLAAYLVSVMGIKSIKLRKLFNGRAVVLMDRGKIYRGNLAASRLDLSEFITMCRAQGYFDLSQIETAILEHNGAVSILPKSAFRPQMPSDTGMDPPAERPKINVILDGRILPDNLELAGRDGNWLRKELSAQGVSGTENIQLAFIDDTGTLRIFPMVREKCNVDWFE